jgi:heme exporter protein B
LHSGNAGLVDSAVAVLIKDLRQELRSRYALNAIFLFGLSTLVTVSFSVGQSNLPPRLSAALFWIIILFSSMSGLAHCFIKEEEAGTALALKLSVDAEPVLLGKLVFNFLLLAPMSLLLTLLFFVFTDTQVGSLLQFILVVVLGVVSLCSATTMIAAIISRASMKGALFAVLSFPILIPLLMVLVKATGTLFEPEINGSTWEEIQFLTAYPVIMITGSFLLFRFVWHE